MKRRFVYGFLSVYALALVSCNALARPLTFTAEDGKTVTTTVGDAVADGVVASSEQAGSLLAALVGGATGNPILAAAASAGTIAALGTLARRLRPGLK